MLLLCLACGAPAALAAAPANDDFADAQQLVGSLPIEVASSNVEATRESGDPDHSPQPTTGNSIWFRWEATSTEAVTVSTCGSEMRTVLGVYLGSALGGLTEVAGGTWESGGCEFQATFRAVAGRTYSIEVDGNAYHDPSQPPVNCEGAVALQIRHRQPPANDDFADATPIGPHESIQAPNLGATKESGEPDHGGNPGGASVWFKFTAPETTGASIQLSGIGTGSHYEIAVYTGSSVANLTPVESFESWHEIEAFPTVAGATYWIAVDGDYDPATETADMGEPLLSLGYGLDNDDFEDAFAAFGASQLNWTSVHAGLINVGATKQPGELDHAGNRGGASVWFRVIAPESGSMQVSACSIDFHPIVAVYTGSALGSLTPVASTSQACGAAEEVPGLGGFNVDAGKAYSIAVDGYDGAWGTFVLTVAGNTNRLELPASAIGKPPHTKIVKRHINLRHRTARFRLGSNQAGSRFLCKLDSRPLRRCGSVVTYRKLAPGRHRFVARAVNAAGQLDATPIVVRFRIPRRAP